jgi:outer membrane usher protein FimD/PapC
MKYSIVTFALICLTSTAFASPDCTSSDAIGKAAVAQAKMMNGHGSTASAGDISFTRTTNDGKQDEYTVQMTVNDECMAEVYVYVKKNTCEVNSAAGGNLTEGACG